MDLVYENLDGAKEQLRLRAEASLVRGKSADEFLRLAQVGNNTVNLAASEDHPRTGQLPSHSNKRDSLLYMLDGHVDVTFTATGKRFTVRDGGILVVLAGVQLQAEYSQLSCNHRVVDTGPSATDGHATGAMV